MRTQTPKASLCPARSRPAVRRFGTVDWFPLSVAVAVVIVVPVRVGVVDHPGTPVGVRIRVVEGPGGPEPPIERFLTWCPPVVDAAFPGVVKAPVSAVPAVMVAVPVPGAGMWRQGQPRRHGQDSQ